MSDSPTPSRAMALADTGGFLVGCAAFLKLLIPALDFGSATHFIANQGIFAGLVLFFLGCALARSVPVPGRGLALLAALAALLFFRGLWAVPAYGLQRAAELFACIGVAVCTGWYMRWPRTRGVVIGALAAGAVAVLVWGVGQEILSLPELRADPDIARWIEGVDRQEFLDRLNALEVFGPFTISNAMAAACIALAFPFGLAALLAGRKRTRVVFAVIAVAALAALLLTRSKGGFLAFGFAACVAGAMYAVQRGMAMRKALLGVALAVLIGASALALLVSYGPPASGRASAEVRAGYYAGAISAVADNPIQGQGPGLFADVYTFNKPGWAGETRHVHNDYLEVAVESGIPGMLLLIAGLLLALSTFAWKSPVEEEPDDSPSSPEHRNWSTAGRAGFMSALLSWLAITLGVTLFGVCDIDNILSHARDGKYAWHALLVFTLVLPPVSAWFVARAVSDDVSALKPLVAGAVVGVAGFAVHSLIDFNLFNENAALVLFAVLGIVRWPSRSVGRGWATAALLMSLLSALLFVGSGVLAEGRNTATTVDDLAVMASSGATNLTEEDRSFLLQVLSSVEPARFDPPELYWSRGMLAGKLVEANPDFAKVAIINLGAAVKLNPARYSFWRDYARALARGGETEEALKAMSRALELYPSSSDLQKAYYSLLPLEPPQPGGD